MFYYDEPYEEHCCVYCEEHDQAKEDMRPFMEGLVDQLYGNERFDSVILDNWLEELALYFGIKMPDAPLKIKSAQSHPIPLTDQILDKWKSLNNQYLKSLAQ